MFDLISISGGRVFIQLAVVSGITQLALSLHDVIFFTAYHHRRPIVSRFDNNIMLMLEMV